MPIYFNFLWFSHVETLSLAFVCINGQFIGTKPPKQIQNSKKPTSKRQKFSSDLIIFSILTNRFEYTIDTILRTCVEDPLSSERKGGTWQTWGNEHGFEKHFGFPHMK